MPKKPDDAGSPRTQKVVLSCQASLPRVGRREESLSLASALTRDEPVPYLPRGSQADGPPITLIVQLCLYLPPQPRSPMHQHTKHMSQLQDLCDPKIIPKNEKICKTCRNTPATRNAPTQHHITRKTHNHVRTYGKTHLLVQSGNVAYSQASPPRQ